MSIAGVITRTSTPRGSGERRSSDGSCRPAVTCSISVPVSRRWSATFRPAAGTRPPISWRGPGVPWLPTSIAASFPDGTFDVVAALGVLEYVHAVKTVLTTIAQRAPLLVTSYCVRTADDADIRLDRGFVNGYSLNEFVDVCQSAGWTVRVAERIDECAGFDQWVFALVK
jgi:hypothetical protein